MAAHGVIAFVVTQSAPPQVSFDPSLMGLGISGGVMTGHNFHFTHAVTPIAPHLIFAQIPEGGQGQHAQIQMAISSSILVRFQKF